MRILQATTAWGMGGAERVALLLAERLLAAGDEVGLAADAGFLDAYLPAGLRRYHVRDHGRSAWGTARTIARTTRVVHDFAPEIIHAHGPRVAAGALAARRLVPWRRRPPVLVTFHAAAPSGVPAAARILAHADHVVCVSAALCARLVAGGLAPGRVSVIQNGLAPEPVEGPPASAPVPVPGLNGAPVVSLVGRLVDQKRPERFVEMAAEVAHHEPEVRFVVVGDGPLRAAAEARARACGVDAAVHFVGQVEDARPLIARSQVLVFTSSWEGLSITALEALSAGVPVVATDTDGMREILSSGAGVIVEDDSPGALAREVLGLLDDPERRSAMGREGRAAIADRFAPERMVAAYRERYAALLAG